MCTTMAEPLSVTVKTSSGGKFVLAIPALSETVAHFKTRLEAVSAIPAASQRLIFRGHVLKDASTFDEVKGKHGLESGHTMHVVRSASAASAPPPAASAPAATPGAVPGMGGVGGMGGMGGMMPGMGAGGDMAEMQRQMLQNPEQMQAMLNSPMMDTIMNNPELARGLMMANPQLRELMENNPEVGHVFNDPATFRQMMQMARNPSLMNEMMRNTDRQMANIEMMPGGFDALRRMHENVQAPLMDAVAGMGNNNANEANADNPFASLFQQNTPSNAPMPNPWAPNNGVPPAQPVNPNPTAAAPRQAPAQQPSGGNAFASLFEGMGAGAGGFGGGMGGGMGMGGGGGPAPGTAGRPPMPGLPPGADPDQMMQMLENPIVQQMMQHMFSDPQMIDSMITNNPQLQAMMQSNPEMATMLRNPDMLRTFLNPDVMRSMMQLRSAMGSSGGGAPGAPGAPGTMPGTYGTGVPRATQGTMPAPTAQHAPAGAPPATGAPPPFDMNGIMAMMNAMNAGRAPGGVAPVPVPAPQPELTSEQLEELYSSQLVQLREMGFLDTAMCIDALRQSRGNVSIAIENLLNRFG